MRTGKEHGPSPTRSEAHVLQSLFSLRGQVAVVTGGTGVLGAEMARGLARAGARVAVLGRRAAQARAVAGEIAGAGGAALPVPADVTDEAQLRAARETILGRWGRLDILVNTAGGNLPAATVPDDGSVFELGLDAFREVLDLNLLGTVRASLVFGQAMVQSPQSRAVPAVACSRREAPRRVRAARRKTPGAASSTSPP